MRFKTDNYLLLGLLFIAISSGLYIINPENLNSNNNIFTALFFVHYSFPVIYVVVLWAKFRRKIFTFFSRSIFSGHIVLLILFNLSAFALNRELPVFSESADWLSVLITVETVLLLLVATYKEIPQWLKVTTLILAPSYILFHLHQVFIAMPMAGFGFIGAIFFGVGLLIFVPVFYLVAYGVTLYRFKINNKEYGLIGIGFLIPLVIIAVHVIGWNQLDKQIRMDQLQIDKPFADTSMPEWVRLSRNLSDSFLTEKYLKSDLVYQAYNPDGFFSGSFNRANYDENAIHDPIISLCMGFSFKPPLDEDSRIRILKFIYDKRHQTADRFWNGDHLTTDQVTTNIQVFPEERISYSELILTIANNRIRRTWRSTEEAIYTFQLPEGGVISSLSLWIEGKEEKAILTTKSKAENAYNTIVGKEQRDPSVIYWMEGSKARIRVFPCTPDEKRKFKLGVTAPLKLVDQKLHYQPIVFEGPDFTDAVASTYIVTDIDGFKSNTSFKKENEFLSWVGNYDPDWGFNIPLQPFKSSSFSFKGQTYTSQPTKINLRNLPVENVYLDLTNNWTNDELEDIEFMFKDYNVVKTNSQSPIQNSLDEFPNFSLFPYHDLKEDPYPIIITKGGVQTPNLEDLKGSSFRDNIFKYFELNEIPPLVLDIGPKPTIYNQSLNEFGVISHHLVTLKDLSDFTSSGNFPDPKPTPDVIHLAGNGISLSKHQASSQTNGSDHLMRLFFYQSILNEIGNRYFSSDNQSYIEEELTNLASEANVVTPLSSLIVLETQKDYDRFEIERNKDSLGNASLKNQGAVPEPHEWALIITGVLIMVGLYFNKLRQLI